MRRTAPAPTATPTQTAVAHAAPPAEATQFVRPARFSAGPDEVPIPFTAPAPVDAQLDDRFRRVHGTEYDPAGEVDRRKMEMLKQARRDTREPAPRRTF